MRLTVGKKENNYTQKNTNALVTIDNTEHEKTLRHAISKDDML